MSKKGILGSPKGVSKCDFVEEAHHQEFSDTNVLTPLWIARPVGANGKRNPCDTLRESAERALSFVELSRSTRA